MSQRISTITTEKPPPFNSVARYTWFPGVIRRAPKIALFFILGILICIFASLAIVIMTNNNQVVLTINWMLGFLGSTSTFLLVIILARGINIFWWRAALHGTSLARLHYLWGYGGSSAAWFSCSHINIVAIATVLTTIASIAYPPLLQRSSTIEWEEFATNTTMKMLLPDQVMDGFTGIVDPTSSGGIDVNPEFLQAIDDTARNISVTTLDEPGYACNGTCYAWVTGAGLWANCTSGEKPIDLTSSDCYQTGAPVFDINFSQYDDDNNIPTLSTSVYYLSSVNDFCQGTIVTEECSVQAAVVKYPIIIEGNTVEIHRNATQELVQILHSTGDSSSAPEGGDAGPLRALAWFATQYYEDNATLWHDPLLIDYTLIFGTLVSDEYYNFTNGEDPNTLACSYLFTNPTVDIIDTFQVLMFRTALIYDLSINATNPQVFDAIQVQPTLIYRSLIPYLAVATALILVALFAVSSLLWGWWELGRPVSLSPLEIAKAFGAPAFDHSDLPADAKGLVAAIGCENHKYGELKVVENDVEHSVLVFGEVGSDREPTWPHTPVTITV
jgi:hypothetical protein